MQNSSVLVLNASYEAINICNLRRAIVLIFKGVACAEEETDHEIRAASLIIRAPAVIIAEVCSDSIQGGSFLTQECPFEGQV